MNDNNEIKSDNDNTRILTVNESINIVRKHYEKKGYLVHSGLQFGCELVLYADDPSRVHSDYCVHVVPQDGSIDWRLMQTLVRSMPDFHKTLILAHVRQVNNDDTTSGITNSIDYVVDELAMASEHAPFQNKKNSTKIVNGQTVGTQVKKQSKNKTNNSTNNSTADNTSSLNNECSNNSNINSDNNNKKAKIIHNDNT